MTDLELARAIERAVDRCCPNHLRASRDDIVQDALVKATRARDEGRTISGAWLRRVAYTTMIDELRARGEVAEIDDALPHRGPDPERLARLAGIRDALDRCMAHLADRRRQAVLLFLQGHTAREAADLLAIRPRTAENLIFRGRSELRACLTRAGATLDAL
jgi:RNA polymerase sigma factor (sigma-70 family)